MVYFGQRNLEFLEYLKISKYFENIIFAHTFSPNLKSLF